MEGGSVMPPRACPEKWDGVYPLPAAFLSLFPSSSPPSPHPHLPSRFLKMATSTEVLRALLLMAMIFSPAGGRPAPAATGLGGSAAPAAAGLGGSAAPAPSGLGGSAEPAPAGLNGSAAPAPSGLGGSAAPPRPQPAAHPAPPRPQPAAHPAPPRPQSRTDQVTDYVNRTADHHKGDPSRMIVIALLCVMAVSAAGLVPLRILVWIARRCGKEEVAGRFDQLANHAACAFVWAFNKLRSMFGYGGNGEAGGGANGNGGGVVNKININIQMSCCTGGNMASGNQFQGSP